MSVTSENVRWAKLLAEILPGKSLFLLWKLENEDEDWRRNNGDVLTVDAFIVRESSESRRCLWQTLTIWHLQCFQMSLVCLQTIVVGVLQYNITYLLKVTNTWVSVHLSAFHSVVLSSHSLTTEKMMSWQTKIRTDKRVRVFVSLFGDRKRTETERVQQKRQMPQTRQWDWDGETRDNVSAVLVVKVNEQQTESNRSSLCAVWTVRDGLYPNHSIVY